MNISCYITSLVVYSIYFVHAQLCKSVKKVFFISQSLYHPVFTWTKHANVSETNLNPVVWENNLIRVSLDQYVIAKRKCEIYIWQEKHYNFTHGLGITVKACPINKG